MADHTGCVSVSKSGFYFGGGIGREALSCYHRMESM